MDDVFDLREFLLKILRRWRLLVVLALICGVLGGAFKLYQGRDVLRGITPPEVVAEPVDIDQQAADALQDSINYSEGQIGMLEEKFNLFQGVDLENSYRLARTIIISVPEGSTANSNQVAITYLNIMGNGGVYPILSKLYPTVISSQNAVYIFSVNISGANFLPITTMGESEQVCIDAMDAIMGYMKEQYADVERVNGAHTLEVINPGDMPMADPFLYQSKLFVENELAANRTNLNYQRNQLTALVGKVGPVAAPVIQTKGSVLKSSITYGILGLIGGIAVGILLTFFLDVMDQTIGSETDLRKRLGLQILGTIPAKGGKS